VESAPSARSIKNTPATGRSGPFDFLRRLPGIGPQKCRNMIAQLEGKLAKYALMPHDAGPTPAPAPAAPAADGLVGLVREVLVRQLGLRPGEADAAIQDALARRPGLDTAEGLFEEIYRARRTAP
jgi:Holliday junction DNA helicase RuvA